MKALRQLIALFAITAVAAFLTGCGDDDNNNNNNNNNGGGNVAPQSLAGRTYNFTTTGAGGNTTQRIAFAPQGNTYTITDQNGNVVSQGTFAVTSTAGANPVNITLTPGNGGATTTIVSTYGTGTTGTFVSTGGIAGSGSFTEQTGGTTAGGTTAGTTAGGTTAGTTAGGTTAGTTAGGTTAGTTAGGTTAGTTAGGTTAGATGVQGKTLQLNYNGGGGEKFAFTSATAASYENGTDTATYTYDPNTGALHIVRSGGQTYDLIVPNGSNTGTTTVRYQEAGGNQSNDAASFTLT
jgi:hypothetical protein